MTDPKKIKILSIDDEEKQLHPLLQVLLPKLPFVVDVEYTHGPNEMGADFVLSQKHPVFGNIEYTGVIAKVGKIVQDFTDIDRQIDECISVQRKFLGGKEMIRINEIWLVITDNITKGAQEKIHEKYKAQKIQFIQGSRLIKLIDEHHPSYWAQTSLMVGEYLSALRLKNESEDRALSLWQFTDKAFYIEQDLYEFPRFEYRKLMARKQKHPGQVSILDAIEKNEIVLIEGGAGSGKSKLLRYLVNYYTMPEVFMASGLLPIYATYKEVIEQYDGNILSLINARIKKELKSETEGKQFLILIDAFDEKKMSDEEQVDALANLVNGIQQIPNVRGIITSRYLVGLDKSNNLEGVVTRLELAPLSMNRTIQFITTLCTNLNLTSRLIEDLKKSPLFRELPRSPISAILLAKLINENPKDLPSNLTELYSQYIELVLGRWEIDKGLQSQKEYQALDNILIRLAECVLDYEMPRITLSDANDLVKEYLSERNLNLNHDEIYDKMINRCDILLVDHQSRTLSFKHRSFAEYFYAKSLIKGKDPKVSERAFEYYWLNTVFFYLGLLKDCPELIAQLTDLEPKTEVGKWLKIVNMANYLLAAYTTPYDKVSIAILRVMREASQLYSDIVSGKIQSPLARLPQMTMLYMMQFIIRHSYSYNFFKEAIEECALRIDEGDDDELAKAYALFFLNVTYIELGGDESFDFLLKNHSDNLSLDLQLALGHEIEDLEERSALMKKQDRRLKHLLKNNSSLNAQVKKLYDQPLKLLANGDTKNSSR